MHLRLDAGEASPSAEAEVDTLTLPVGSYRSLHGHCDSLTAPGGVYDCSGASVVVGTAGDRVAMKGRIGFDPRARALAFDVTAAAPGGLLGVRANVTASRWSADVQSAAFPLAALAPWLAGFVEWSPTAQPAGMLALTAHAEGAGSAPDALEVRAELDGITFSAFADRVAAESLGGMLEVRARPVGGGPLDVELELRGDSGQGYVEPWFVDAGAHPFTLRGAGTCEPGARRLTLERLEVGQSGVLDASGQATFEPPHVVRSLALDISRATLPGAYQLYLQPVLIGTVLDELETQGTANGRLEIEDGAPARFELALDDVHAEDRHGRFGVYGVTGDLRWARAADTPPVSSLAYRGAALYGVPFDAGTVRVESLGTALRVLATPVRAPLLDGALVIRTLALRGLGTDSVEADFDAELEPIDISRLTSALGWVPFSGTLSGRLPTLRYADGVLTLGGALEADVFGGHISIDGVRLEQPLGVLPKLQAEVRMRDIDLERLTSTFSFGHMTGTLAADVLGLQVVDWQAEEFDARIYTPPGDERRHRISQRAVKSIAAIGGGATAALSQGALRFFDEFDYDRFELRCRMRDQVCAMDGIESKGEGYYILRGKGLPHIDVVGYQRSVSWPALSSAVVAAARSGDVVIE